MQYLRSKWFQLNDSHEAARLFEQRIQGETTQKTGLTIRASNKPSETFELYYLPTASTITKIEAIFQADKRLDLISQSLFPHAKDYFLYQLIAEEMYSSNEIEGVHSSKQELARSTRQLAQKKVQRVSRMNSMISSYVNLPSASLPSVPQDIRTIYDQITEGEIDPDNLPDGDIFITDCAELIGNDYSKIIHTGVCGEESITQHISELLHFLNHRDDVPFLVKLAIGHYYFGYIHPFYDGNGRTSRFITSLYLSKSFSIYTAYSFAIGCRLLHSTYLNLFNYTNDFRSYGEANYAIDSFLDILISGQNHVIDLLEQHLDKWHKALSKIENDTHIGKEILHQSIAMFLCAVSLFSDDTPVFSQQDIIDICVNELEAKTNTIKRALKDLEAYDYIIKIKQRPIQYIFNEAYIDNL